MKKRYILSEKMWKPDPVSTCGEEGFFDTKDVKDFIKLLKVEIELFQENDCLNGYYSDLIKEIDNLAGDKLI